jgi:hypothetical protein
VCQVRPAEQEAEPVGQGGRELLITRGAGQGLQVGDVMNEDQLH